MLTEDEYQMIWEAVADAAIGWCDEALWKTADEMLDLPYSRKRNGG